MSSYKFISGIIPQKVKFPKESFLIAGISHYQDNMRYISLDTKLTMIKEPENKYDKNAIKIKYEDKCLGYVPNKSFYKDLCFNNINYSLNIINIKRDKESNNYGIRVIPESYYTPDMKELSIF